MNGERVEADPSLIVRLVLIADVGAIGPRVIDEAIAVLAAVPPRSILLIERDKTGTDDRTRLTRLVRLRAATRAAGCRLAVNTRVDLALASEADGVHLPEDGLDPMLVHARFPGLRVGRSYHQALPDHGGAPRLPVDWALVGPIRAPHSKPLVGEALGFDGLARVIGHAPTPVYALGGMLPDDLAAAQRAGATGLATIGGVFGTRAPERAALEYLRRRPA